MTTLNIFLFTLLFGLVITGIVQEIRGYYLDRKADKIYKSMEFRAPEYKERKLISEIWEGDKQRGLSEDSAWSEEIYNSE